MDRAEPDRARGARAAALAGATGWWVTAACGLLLHPGPASAGDDYYADRTVWDRFGGGHLNISSFAFRDIDRDGVYDMADQPMAGVMFEVAGGGRTIKRRTNKSGFGNFAMSVLDRDKDIVNRGEYVFRAVVPPGWVLTTDNATQTTFFELMPGAPADLVSSTPMQPVGLAQELSISGTVAVPGRPFLPVDTTGEIAVRALQRAGEHQEAALDRTGSFSFAAAPGSWTVRAEDGEGEVVSERRIDLARAPVVLSTLRPGEVRREAGAPASVITFDDLVRAGIKEVPSGYRGLDWRNWVVTHNKFYDGEGYVNTTMSGEFVAYNSSGHPVSIRRERPFDFIGGFFGSAWLRAEGETLQIEGWRGPALVYQETIELSAMGPVHFAANFRDITRLEFRTQRYWQFVCDDLEFSLPD